MTLREKQARFWVKVGMVLVKAAAMKTPLVITDWMRTEQEQAMLVARGASKTMRSKHLEGLAVDVVFLNDLLDDGRLNYRPERYREIGEYAESIGLRWGGRFGVPDDQYDTQLGWDCGHFEYRETTTEVV